MRRERSTAQRRETIVLAALHCFVEKGFHQASMRDIATQAGVSVGNVYNHFADKDALIAEIAALEMQELHPLLEALEHAEPLEGLLRFAKRYAAICMQPDNVMLTSEVIAEAARNPALAALFAKNHAVLVTVLSRTLTRGMDVGALDATLPPSATAALMLDAIEGHALRAALFAPKTAALKRANEDLATLLRKLLTQ
ncbi:TetR/AcrR family transcriptional regulator [Rhodoferax aquaticus]|uniref:TetR/AcrR family transcriptional regulator n=2 Tax=Rhodoferax aquaticus TaxID=2527691 RepID=A0A515EVB6_9BURK|nr:TetR/AcrR family transcriptional regulator [Rhodoferax aquaticus]